MAKTYKRKPQKVEAFRFGHEQSPGWFDPTWIAHDTLYKGEIVTQHGYIPSDGGYLLFNTGDYIVRNSNGEVYPSEASVFEKDYEEVI